ncbi:MAG: hypothetical protein N2112_04830 [Gemmataceae bacterium]|jgi:hypothetical protein|nr:hypothetical protein [Gemmataceae bacterium]
MWVRLFCGVASTLRPSQIAEKLSQLENQCQIHFTGDDLGWKSAEIRWPSGSPLSLERYLTQEDDLRPELNTWAAYLETLDYSPHSISLMERVIQTVELIIFRKPLDHSNEVILDQVISELVQMFAQNADGIFQIDGEGWYNAQGELLIPEY